MNTIKKSEVIAYLQVIAATAGLSKIQIESWIGEDQLKKSILEHLAPLIRTAADLGSKLTGEN